MKSHAFGADIQKILVAVDGSKSSIMALRWAVNFYKKNGGELEVTSVWQVPFPTIELVAIGLSINADELSEHPRKIAQHRLNEVMKEVCGESHPAGIKTSIEEGYASLVLIEKSREVDLLIMGNRGHSPLASTLIGSVSSSCIAHAHCPVVIIKE